MANIEFIPWVIITCKKFLGLFKDFDISLGCSYPNGVPNQRKKGTKLVGAYVSNSKNAKIKTLAARLGFSDKASFLRALLDLALAEGENLSFPKNISSDESTVNTITVKGGGTVKNVTQARNVGKKRKKS